MVSNLSATRSFPKNGLHTIHIPPCIFRNVTYFSYVFVHYLFLSLNHLPSASFPQLSAQNIAGVLTNIKNTNVKTILLVIFGSPLNFFFLTSFCCYVTWRFVVTQPVFLTWKASRKGSSLLSHPK